MSAPSAPASSSRRVNVRTPEIMERVHAEVETHYRSEIVEHIRARGGEARVANTTIRLAKDFGFCYGVERAIDLAYAAAKSSPNERSTSSVRSFTTQRSTAKSARWASSASRSRSRSKPWLP